MKVYNNVILSFAVVDDVESDPVIEGVFVSGNRSGDFCMGVGEVWVGKHEGT